MTRVRKPYIAGNWKMNLDRGKALDLIKVLKGRLGDGHDREVAVFPPFVYLADVSAVAQGSPLGVGGQNIHWDESGAFTGEISAPMLRDVGADRVIIGHSERRHVFKEANEWMGRKVRSALDHDLLPIVCVGELADERKSGKTERVVRKQLEAAFDWVKKTEMRRITIAYEPVWAIGTGETATPEQAAQVHKSIRHWIGEKFGTEASQTIRIQYGGSVSPQNVRELMAVEDVDGVLVGGASLRPDTFFPIMEFDV
jgi:triosephosphate isomerase